MANELRVRQNFVGGLIESNPLLANTTTVTDGVTTASSTTVTSATAAFVAGDVGHTITGGSIPANTTIASVTNGTTAVLSAAATATASAVTFVIGRGNLLTSAALAAVPTIGSTQHYPIVLDPDGLYGEPEIAWVTAHTAGTATATLLRAQESTTAREHKRDINWLHGPLVSDFDRTAYGARVFASTVTSLASGVETVVAFDSETFDVGGYHDTVTNNSRLTVPAGRGGKYIVSAAVGIVTSTGGSRRYCAFKKNGTVYSYGLIAAPVAAGNNTHTFASDMIQLVDSDYVEVIGFQDSAGALNTLNASTTVWASIVRIGD